jgi:hypothetical protein
METRMFALLDHLVPSAQAAVSMLCDRIASRTGTSGTERNKDVEENPDV